MSPLLTRAAIVAEARGWIGTPYIHQASVKGVGCDCLGLVRGIWRALIGPEPEAPGPYAPAWAEAGAEERLLAAGRRHFVGVDCASFQPGDVLLFRWQPHLPAKHLGLATSRETMIHAHDGASVAEVGLRVWRRKLAFAFAFPGIETSES
jgi:NlpC/P60 family putative phage cell wall peptidase